MAQLLPNDFTCYELTTPELMAGSDFSPLQKMYLQNLLYNEMMERATLTINFQEADEATATKLFIQRQAYIDGKIACLKLLLTGAYKPLESEDGVSYNTKQPAKD